jgi:hypothetical protein
MVNFICCGCGAELQIGDEWAGKLGRCPHCSANSRIPGSPKRTSKLDILARFFAWPVTVLGFWTIFLGWPIFLGGIVAVSVGLFGWAFTNVVTWLWCMMDGTSHHLKIWKRGEGDPFWDTFPFNPDPPSVRFKELYREKLRQENEQFGPVPPVAPDMTKSIDDPNVI